MRDTENQFSPITIGLHWLIALLMIGLIGLGLTLAYIEQMPETRRATMDLHKSLGVTIIAFAIIRIGWRMLNGLPKDVAPMKSWQKTASKWTHIALLVSTLMMPITGLMASVGGGFGLVWFGTELVAKGAKYEFIENSGRFMHTWAGYAMIFFVVLHIAAALKHHVIDKDRTLRRMIGSREQGRTSSS